MKHKLLSAIASVFVCASFACQPSSYAPVDSGIDFKLSAQAEDGSPLRPDGLFHVTGLDRPLSLHVPVTPAEPGAALQRLELPPGSYAVSYLPTALDFEIDPSRGRHPVKILSQNPFLVVVSEGQFTPVNVRTPEAAPAERVTQVGRHSARGH
jgi:hypothetical protein